MILGLLKSLKIGPLVLTLVYISIAEVGKMMTSYLQPIPLPSTRQVNDKAFAFKKKVGSRGRFLLPSTFGKVEVEVEAWVEGTPFPQAGSLKSFVFHPGGDMGCRKAPIWEKYVTS